MSRSPEKSRKLSTRIGLLAIALSTGCMPQAPESQPTLTPAPTIEFQEIEPTEVEPPIIVTFDIYKGSTSWLEVNGHELEVTFLQNPETHEWILTLGDQELCRYEEESGENWRTKSVTSRNLDFDFGSVQCISEVRGEFAALSLEISSFSQLETQWDSIYPAPNR